MAKKREEKIEPKLTDFIGKKVRDMSRESGETIIHFTNGYKLAITGNISLRKEVE